jgi:hypothetical protein
MQTIFNNATLTETAGSSWLIAESTENLATVANADGLYATTLPAIMLDEWPLL